MLRDVIHKVSDGLLGFATSTGDGISIKIGASPIDSDHPVTITGAMSAEQIKQRLGLSPLADAVMDSVQFGANRLYCFPVSASVVGVIGTINKDGSGSGKMIIEGSPTNVFDIIVNITAQGAVNSAAFIASIDGGYSFTDELTIPVSGEYELAGTGLTLKFTDAANAGDVASSFLINDSYKAKTTAPAMTNGDIMSAIKQLRVFNQEHEFCHIVGPTNLAAWQMVSVAQAELMDVYHKPMFFVMEAAMPPEGDITDWALQMEADRKQVKNTDIQVITAWGRLVTLDGVSRIVNLAGMVCGMYARASVQISIGKTRTEAGFGIPKTQLSELLPAGMDNTIIEILDLAGYLTFREYDGLDDYFVYHTKMMCPPGSDYRYAEDIRVKNKIIRETRKEGLLILNDDIDLEDVQGELETRAKFMFTPLQRMINAKEISSAEITVPAGQAATIIEDETMRVKIRYLSRGYIREIEVDLGRSAPSSD